MHFNVVDVRRSERTCWTFVRRAIHLRRHSFCDLVRTSRRLSIVGHFCKCQVFGYRMNWTRRWHHQYRPTNNLIVPSSLKGTFGRCMRPKSMSLVSKQVNSLQLGRCHIVYRIRWWTIAHKAGIRFYENIKTKINFNTDYWFGQTELTCNY